MLPAQHQTTESNSKLATGMVNIGGNLGAKEPDISGVGGDKKTRAKRRVNIWCPFVRCPETQLQMNANV